MMQTLVVRTAGDPVSLMPAIRRQVWSVDPEQPILRTATVAADYVEFFATPRLAARLMTGSATTGLLIAVVGLYGAVAHAVARREREFGIRLALGARPADISRLTLVHAATVLVVGIGTGLTLAFGSTSLLGSLLVEVPPLDPLAFTGAVAVLVAAALTACVYPARRAARVQPTQMLRAE